MDATKIGTFIAAERRAKGWTQRQLADKLQLTDSFFLYIYHKSYFLRYIMRLIISCKIRKVNGFNNKPFRSKNVPAAKSRDVLNSFRYYRCSTRSLISAVRPWFQNWVPI